MLSEIKNNYKDIFAHFNFNSAERNKQKLIEMAKNGEKRPSKKTKIGRALTAYTYDSGNSYDPTFTKKIKKLRPNWFYYGKRSQKNKEKLIEMAKNGEKRPTRETKIGRALKVYTSKSNDYCDPTFTKQIKKLRPDWFNHVVRSKK